MKIALIFLFIPSLVLAQGSFSNILKEYSKKEYITGKDSPVTRLTVTPSLSEKTRTASWVQSNFQQLTNYPLAQNKFCIYDSIRDSTFDLQFVAQRERYEYNIRRLYDSRQLRDGNPQAKQLYEIQKKLKVSLGKSIPSAYWQITLKVLETRGYEAEIIDGKLVIQNATMQEFKGDSKGFEFAGQQMNVGELGHALIVTPTKGNNSPKLLFRHITIMGGLQPNGSGQPKYDSSYRFSWATEEGIYLLQGKFKHTTAEKQIKYLPQMPLETHEVFGVRFGSVYRLRDALNLYDHPENQIPSRVCTHDGGGKNTHVFNQHKLTLVTSLAGQPIKALDDIKSFASSDYLRDRRIPISIYTPRKQGQIIPVTNWNYRSLYLYPDTNAIRIAREKRVEEERLKEQARQEVKNREHKTRLDMDKAHQEELYRIAKQRSKERYKRQLEIISQAQTKFIPELKLMAKEDPRMALSFFKYLYDHTPKILTPHQRIILGKIHYAQENFIIESRPLNVRNINKDFPLEMNELNTNYQSVGIAKGEMVITNSDYNIWLVVPIECPNALVEKLLAGDSYKLTLVELFKTSRFGGGVLAKGYNKFDCLGQKPVLEDGYRHIVTVEKQLRPYGRKFYPPKIFRSKIIKTAAVVWGGAVLITNGIHVAEELQKAQFDYDEENPQEQRKDINPKSFGKVNITRKHPETGAATRKICHYKASNRKTYTLVYMRRFKDALIGHEYEGWKMSNDIINPALPGYDRYRSFSTKEELATYIESCIGK